MIVHAYGEEAVLVELDGPAAAVALRETLEARPIHGTVETIPGLQTVLVRFDPRAAGASRIAAELQAIVLPPDRGRDPERSAASASAPAPVLIRVDYSGRDLVEVAERTGLGVKDVISAHTARIYRVALIGMSPGFYYLAGGDPRLRVPRRATPRTDVPKGALGLAGGYSGIYPRLGPGGWLLIGRVVEDLWHPTRVPAALLAPGSAVTFVGA